MQLPDDLRLALETELSGTPLKAMAEASQSLSRRYREGHARSQGPSLSALDARAYAAYRMPATYAAIWDSLREIQARLPNWQPSTMLDIAGGPGTAGWAATDLWPELEQITVIERNSGMIAAGRALSQHADSPSIRTIQWNQADIASTPPSGSADLVVVGYALGELSEQDRRSLTRSCWNMTEGVLLLVEPGTPRGYSLIAEASEQIEEALVIAPVPADWPCLSHEDDWLHFSVRAPRTRLQRAAKGGSLAYEDEKYSYVALSRLPGTPIAGRVIRHPQVRSGYVILTICTEDGVREITVTRSNKAAYRRAKDLRWGSTIEPSELEMLGLSWS
jgi:ribosomal protein RSM22 (predicted rRNA methylase)